MMLLRHRTDITGMCHHLDRAGHLWPRDDPHGSTEFMEFVFESNYQHPNVEVKPSPMDQCKGFELIYQARLNCGNIVSRGIGNKLGECRSSRGTLWCHLVELGDSALP